MIPAPSYGWMHSLGLAWLWLAVPLLYLVTRRHPRLCAAMLLVGVVLSGTMSVWAFVLYGPLTPDAPGLKRAWISWAVAVVLCVVLYRQYLKPRTSA